MIQIFQLKDSDCQSDQKMKPKCFSQFGLLLTEMPQAGQVKQQTSITQFWSLGNSISRCWKILCLLRTCFLDFRGSYSHCIHTWQRVKRGNKLSQVSSFITPFLRAPPSWCHLILIIFWKVYCPIPLHWGGMILPYGFFEDIIIQSIVPNICYL